MDEATVKETQPPVGASRAAAVGEQASSGEDLDLLDLLLAVVAQKGLVAKVTVVVTLVAVAAALLLPVRYTATATLMPPQRDASLSTALASQLGSAGGSAGMAALAGGALSLKTPGDLYVALFRSRTVEDAMIQRFQLANEYRTHYDSATRKSFENHSMVDSSAKDGLIHVSVDDHDASRAAAMTNAYVEELQHLSDHLAIGSAAERRLFFEQQMQQAKNQLSDAEVALQRTEQQTGLIQPEGQSRALIETAAALRGEIVAKTLEISALRTYATDQNGQLVQAEKELDSLLDQQKSLAGGTSKGNQDVMINGGQVSTAGLDYVRKLRDVKYYESMFEILARQYEVAKLDEAKEGPFIQVIDSAVTPDRRSFPKRTFIVLGGFAGGLLLGILLVIVRISLRNLAADPHRRQQLTALGRALGRKA